MKNRIMLVAILGLCMRFNGHVTAAALPSELCDDVCSPGGACDDDCFATELDFENGEPVTTCQDYNGDAGCCGDGVCQTDELCTGCDTDCGDAAYCAYECLMNTDCASGEICDTARECVEPPNSSDPNMPSQCSTSCSHYWDCCGDDVCYQGTCATPTTSDCSDSPTCTSSADCTGNGSGACAGLVYSMYCDPGINRCQFQEYGYGCVDSDYSNACK